MALWDGSCSDPPTGNQATDDFSEDSERLELAISVLVEYIPGSQRPQYFDGYHRWSSSSDS